MRAGTLKAVAMLSAVSTLCGCLANSYEVPRGDLLALASMPAAERGRAVRAVQNTVFADEPPFAPGPQQDPMPPAPANVYVPRPVGIFWHHHPPVVVYDSWPPARARRPVAVSTTPGPSVSSGGTAGTTARPFGSSAGSSSSSGNVSSSKGAAAAVIIAAALVLFVVAGIEGSRYDGWVALHPDHPIHLRDRAGNWQTLPLSALEPGTVELADEAAVRLSEGAGGTEIGRAPLWREGWTLRMHGGGGGGALDAARNGSGVGFDVQLGKYMTQWLGFVGHLGFAWGKTADRDFFAGRYGLEAQFMPLRAWRLHAGGYAGLGLANVYAEGGGAPDLSWDGLWTSLGAMAELELATRISALVRWGGIWDGPQGAGRDTPTALTVGLGVY